MKAILLNGISQSDESSDRIRNSAVQNLKKAGYEVEEVILREKTIGNCAGDFFCWIRTPGICNVKDDNLDIAKSIIESDLAVYLTPVTFGGYSSTLKKMVDHQIQNISPYFARVEGETHHQKRYDTYPDFLVLGYSDTPNPQSEAVFKQLVHRNAINFFAKKAFCEVIDTNQTDNQIMVGIQNSLDQLQSGVGIKSNPEPFNPEKPFQPITVKRAVLLVGSPRTRKSTSNSLGEYLYKKLEENHIQTEIIHLHTITHSTEKTEAMLKSIDSADIVTLAFPLYVDSLAAPVIKTLETIASQRTNNQNPHPQLFTAIANCGFPEAAHNTSALAICEVFANQTGFIWGGSLSLGGGGMVDGTPISELGGRGTFIKKSLDLASQSLILGKSIPDEAQSLMTRSIIPAWLYRFIGSLGWNTLAKKFNVQNQLRRKPYKMSTAFKEN